MQFKFQNALSLLERDLSAAETINQLKCAPSVFFSWGVHNLTAIQGPGFADGKKVENEIMERGLVFQVQGFKLEGFVLITLDWVDVYKVHFFDKDSNHLKTVEGVYVDMLHDVIDDEVERDERFYGKS
jgi:hypothetical protein